MLPLVASTIFILAGVFTVLYSGLPGDKNLSSSEKAFQELNSVMYEPGLAIKDTDCRICLTPYESGHVLKQMRDCQHTFHSVCLSEWMKNQKTCPCCRGQIYHDLHHESKVDAIVGATNDLVNKIQWTDEVEITHV